MPTEPHLEKGRDMCTKGNKLEPIRKGSPPDIRKVIIAKAITDTAFRKTLFTSPDKIFGEGRLGERDHAAIERLKVTVPALDALIGALAGEISSGG